MKPASVSAVALLCAIALTASPLLWAEEPTTREVAPDTDRCPQATWPPKAQTTSEAPTSISPLPQLYDGPCGITAPDGFKVDDNVLASSWLVADVDSGEVIAMKDPHGRYRPASIIKVLLAMVVINELPMEQEVTVSLESASQQGSAVGIGEGGVYTVEQLLLGLLLASGNDAAHALAQTLGGDEATLRKINALASELGTTDTRVATYSGLDASGMQTSAWDLGLMYRAAYADPTFSRLVNTESVEFPGYGDTPGYELWNDNQLFMNDPNGIGGKTGFTDDANHTFVGALGRDGRRLMAIILDTTVGEMRPWQQSQALLHEAYNFDTSVAELTQLPEPPKQAPPVVAQAKTNDDPDDLAIGIVVGVLLAAVVAIFVGEVQRRRRR
ncbi:serine hydrolase [Corynebacterium breve]|uniref:Serine hydrolase n=1 Tax=Corynebacterium breve TaxID=3049799 RepID=A0ABY8VL84_9CORY|nr:serine hydrolase [Corynebacterium breve]WIM68988.1 serine hydrolase [Corynebacterium breve]